MLVRLLIMLPDLTQTSCSARLAKLLDRLRHFELPAWRATKVLQAATALRLCLSTRQTPESGLCSSVLSHRTSIGAAL